MKAIIKIVGGIVLILIGIVGLILPILPGWALIIPGMMLLSDYCPPIKRLLAWGKAKFEQHDPGFFRKPQPPQPEPAREAPDVPVA